MANNASDRNDIGILTGNWTGDYSDGVSPTTWNGSGGVSKQFSIFRAQLNGAKEQLISRITLGNFFETPVK